MNDAKRSFLVIFAVAVALFCSTACSTSGGGALSSDPNASESQTASGFASEGEASVYETEYFEIELPPSWGLDWDVEMGQEYRSSMNATNYSYAFTYDGLPQFTIECKLFSLDADAAIASTGQRQVEFHASDNLTSEDGFYILQHLKVKQETQSTQIVEETGGQSTASAGSSPTETDSDLLSGPVESESDALNRVHDCLMRAGKKIPPKIEFDHMTESGRYVIHGYEIVGSGKNTPHQATWFWYSVGEDGSIYDEVMMCDIDPLTMEEVGKSAAPANDYYTVTLPSELSDAEFSYEEGRFGGPTTAGAITGVRLNGDLLFEVVCLSNDWGPQGDMAILEIGVPSASPSSVVYLTVPLMNVDGSRVDQSEAEAKAKEYASYVTLL